MERPPVEDDELQRESSKLARLYAILLLSGCVLLLFGLAALLLRP